MEILLRLDVENRDGGFHLYREELKQLLLPHMMVEVTSAGGKLKWDN